MIVTRFAPSPTGFLHLGHACAALTAFEAARAADGSFHLRIENIDLTRCRPDFEAAIFEDLRWLGLSWPVPVRRQSEHFADYRSALNGLDSLGLLYPCFCTRKEIAEEIARADFAPEAAELSPEGPLYPGICRTLTTEIRRARIARGDAYALRLDVAKALASLGRELIFDERGHGANGESGIQAARPEIFGDVVLARKEMPTSYHLAVVVDDALQGVTLVTRGEDLFPATHIQRLLQGLLDLPTPVYAHHRLILDRSGRKFSKRDRAPTLRNLRQSGATPEDVRVMIGL
ncbi:MAG TPA: tRNA glutamyl-Q(34) synthetase GluQRS [Micropepsaceae bacterium]